MTRYRHQTRLLACLAAAALLSGCANMTPEERAAFSQNFGAGLAYGAAAGQRPVYVQPSYGPPLMRTTNCQRFGNSVNCTSW